MRVKICGITNVRDAITAVEAGADAIGLIFTESPRRISLARAKEIVRAVGPWVATVGVFVNEPLEHVIRAVSECRLSAVQLHGDESAEYARRLSPFKVIKAFHVGTDFNFGQVKGYEAAAFLFDTKAGGRRGGSARQRSPKSAASPSGRIRRSPVADFSGGTGRTFDWSILRKGKFSRPMILSGGLNPKNVRQAIQVASPYGVDASSGVESAPGVKDRRLVREFIQNAKQV